MASDFAPNAANFEGIVAPIAKILTKYGTKGTVRECCDSFQTRPKKEGLY